VYEGCALILEERIGEILSIQKDCGMIGHQANPLALDQREMLFKQKIGTLFDLRIRLSFQMGTGKHPCGQCHPVPDLPRSDLLVDLR
jgi:hypothetical protein